MVDGAKARLTRGTIAMVVVCLLALLGSMLARSHAAIVAGGGFSCAMAASHDAPGEARRNHSACCLCCEALSDTFGRAASHCFVALLQTTAVAPPRSGESPPRARAASWSSRAPPPHFC